MTEPAARAVCSVGDYIRAMGFKSELAAQAADFTQTGIWEPVNWLLMLCIALLAITIVAVASKYDNVSESKNAENVESKYQLFYGGEANVFSQVGGGDLFWGFKHNWRRYFRVMGELHSGVVSDYTLYGTAAIALTLLLSALFL